MNLESPCFRVKAIHAALQIHAAGNNINTLLAAVSPRPLVLTMRQHPGSKSSRLSSIASELALESDPAASPRGQFALGQQHPLAAAVENAQVESGMGKRDVLQDGSICF